MWGSRVPKELEVVSCALRWCLEFRQNPVGRHLRVLAALNFSAFTQFLLVSFVPFRRDMFRSRDDIFSSRVVQKSRKILHPPLQEKHVQRKHLQKSRMWISLIPLFERSHTNSLGSPRGRPSSGRIPTSLFVHAA